MLINEASALPRLRYGDLDGIGRKYLAGSGPPWADPPRASDSWSESVGTSRSSTRASEAERGRVAGRAHN